MSTLFTLPGQGGTIRLPSTQVIAFYLYILGGIFACLLLVLALMIVMYVCQLLLVSIGEVVHAFNALDPLVRLLILALVTVIVFWRLSHHWRAQGYGKH